jgi:hypothetical protein
MCSSYFQIKMTVWETPAQPLNRIIHALLQSEWKLFNLRRGCMNDVSPLVKKILERM